MIVSGTHHIAVQTRDWAASMRLYQDVLGMTLVAQFGSPERKIVLLDIGDGTHIELFEPQSDTPAVDAPAANDPVIHFALATTDTRNALEHVRQAGYEVTVEPKDATLGTLEVTIAFFKGPNGEIIEFFQTH
ncbi:MAG: VOC family protein [Anaerolineae bacterium]|nr:VOC family protein [Anaerolineae bacterium]MCA9894757.1 VOC family protein [Anaerolineae bacterium]